MKVNIEIEMKEGQSLKNKDINVKIDDEWWDGVDKIFLDATAGERPRFQIGFLGEKSKKEQ